VNYSLSVVICTIGRKKELIKALRGVSQQSILPQEVIVVIGPDGEDYSFLDNLNLKGISLVTFFIEKKNLSWARNLGILNSKSEYVLFLDDDAVAEPRLIENYYKTIRKSDRDILGGFCRIGGFLNWQHQKQVLNTNFEIRQPRESESPSAGEFFSPMGANFLVKRSTALEIDGFDNYLAWWGDDADFALRAKKFGFEVEFVNDAVVHHFQAQSDLRDENLVPKSQYIPWRSYSYLCGKHSLNLGQTTRYISWRRAESRLGLKSLHIRNLMSEVEYTTQISELDLGMREGFTKGLKDRNKQISGARDVHFHENQNLDNQIVQKIPSEEREGFSSTVFIYRERKSDSSGGVANWIYDTAKAITQLGHSVVVISDGTKDWETRVNFNSGFWDIQVGREELYFLSTGHALLPNDLHTFGVAAKNLVTRLDPCFKFTSIVVPIFEGIGSFFLGDSRLVTSLHTSTKESLVDHPLLPFGVDLTNYFNHIINAEEKVLRRSPRLLANSNAILNKYEINQDQRVEVIPHGVPNSDLPKDADNMFTFDGQRPTCTFLGRWEPRKGSAFLPRIIDTLLSLNVNVIVAGADPFNLRKAALSNLDKRYSENLKVLEVLTESEKSMLISKSEVLMIPSIFESFGLIAIEGLMGGAGVCAYSGSGVQECLMGAPHARLLPIGATDEFAQECANLALKMHNQPDLRMENMNFGILNYSDGLIAKRLAKYFA
jgi:GT2 family glycosyltransferase